MIHDDISDQITDEVDAIEDAKVLLGLMNKPQAMEFLKLDYSTRNRWGPQLSQEEREEVLEDKKEEFEEIYNDATSALEQNPPSFHETEVELRDMPDDDEVQDYISRFINSEYFQEAFGNVPDGLWEIKLVPLDSLVAYQPHVTTKAHQRIPTFDDSLLDVLRYCFPLDVKNYLQVNGKSNPDQSAEVRFVSRNPNVNFTGPVIETIDDRPAGNVSVKFEIKPRPNFVQVANFQNRYILKNGYHRSYQLLQAGEDYIPAVVLYAQNYGETGAAGSGWFPDNMILGPRPPLARDFLTDTAVDLEVKGKNKMIRLSAEKMDVER